MGYVKKLTEEEFVKLIIDKELEIAGTDVRYEDLKKMPKEKQAGWYDKYSFKTYEQFAEWKKFFDDHFYDWKPRSTSKTILKKVFAEINLYWGLRCDFTLTEEMIKKLRLY